MTRTSSRQLLAAVGVPLLVIVVATIYLVVIRDRLPEQVATHWGADGVADGFTSRSNLPWLVAAIAFAVSARFEPCNTAASAGGSGAKDKLRYSRGRVRP